MESSYAFIQDWFLAASGSSKKSKLSLSETKGEFFLAQQSRGLLSAEILEHKLYIMFLYRLAEQKKSFLNYYDVVFD